MTQTLQLIVDGKKNYIFLTYGEQESNLGIFGTGCTRGLICHEKLKYCIMGKNYLLFSNKKNDISF